MHPKSAIASYSSAFLRIGLTKGARNDFCDWDSMLEEHRSFIADAA
jgi:hypothetical protein